MKKYIYILAAAAAFVGCAKEVTPTEEIQNQKPETGVKTVTFTASIESPDTKGTIASGGAFTWSDTDEIAVWTNVGKKTATASKISGGIAEFTFTLGEGESIAEGAILVYPAFRLSDTNKNEVSLLPEVTNTPEESHGPILAAKVGTDRTTLNFKYVCGTVQATITGIPSFADRIWIQFTGGSPGAENTSISFNDETPVVASGSGDNITGYLPSGFSGGNQTITLPVPGTGSRSFYFAIKDDNVELFYKNMSKSLTFARNSYFKMAPLAITTLRFVESGVTMNKIRLTSYDNSNNQDVSVAATLSDGSKLVILPGQAWSEPGDPIKIEVMDQFDSILASTDCFYVREATFTVTSGDNSLKTAYRIYPHNAYNNISTPTIWAGKCSPLTFEVVNQTIIGTPKIHCWVIGGSDITTWPGDDMADTGRTDNNNKIWSYTIPDTYYGQHVGYKIGNGNDWYTGDNDYNFINSNTGFSPGYLYNDNGTLKISIPSGSNKQQTVDISDPWPGTSFTKKDAIDPSVYFELAEGYCGLTIKVKFSSNGSNETADWYPFINRDYDYGY